MDEMPSSWWERSGYRTCILIAFLFFAILAIICCCFSLFLAKQQKKQDIFLDTSGNLSRIQRALLDSSADEFSGDKEIMINGTVENGVLVDGILILTVRVNKTENGQGYPIDPRIPTVLPTSITSTTPIIEYSKKQTISVPRNPNSSFNEASPGINSSPNNDPNFVTNSHIDTRPKIDPDSDLEFNAKKEDKYFNIKDANQLDHRYDLRSVEISSNDDSNSENYSKIESSTDFNDETESMSNETTTDMDPTWSTDSELYLNTSTTTDENETTESIANSEDSEDTPELDEKLIDNGPIAKPLTAAVEQLELPSNFDNHINTEQKFFLKKNENSAFNKLHLPLAAGFKNIAKKSFIGYPSYYGLWFNRNPIRDRENYVEALHKSNEFEDVPLSLVMDDVLNRMASVDSSKIDTFKENQPLYVRKFHPQVANPIPQEPNDDADVSTFSSVDETNEAQSTSPSVSTSLMSSEAGVGSSSTVGIETTEATNGQQSTSTTLYTDDWKTSSTDSSEVTNGQQSTSTSEYHTNTDYDVVGKSTKMTGSTDTATDTPPVTNTMQPSVSTPPAETVEPSNHTTPSDDDCSICDFYCDDISTDSSCEETCKLRDKLCIKRGAEDSLTKDSKILKKTQAKVKRDTSSMNHFRRLGSKQQKSPKLTFDLFSVFVPKRNVARYALQNDQ